MVNPQFPHQVTRVEVGAEQREVLAKQIGSGASWFYWIAGLSLINAVILLFNGKSQFVVGLAITYVAYGAGGGEPGTAGPIAGFIATLIVGGIFVLFGVLAMRLQTWAFITGIVLYILDAVIFLMFKDWMSVGFHAFALFFMFSGLKALSTLNAMTGRPRLTFGTPHGAMPPPPPSPFPPGPHSDETQDSEPKPPAAT